MKHSAWLIAAGLLATSLPTTASDSNPLVAERWKTRPVIVVVPTRDDALLRRVESALARTATREAFIDREMVLYTVAGGEGRRNAAPLAPAETRAMLSALRLDAAGPPTFVLVGKDGGVKMTEGPGVDLDAVFAEIDRMPMRRR
ncbi:MAG: DUF4174 domain-containing protein [Variovorax sp.]|nr:MAG: DUF4174 domain-containing protein [Variovorax sp.]